MVRDKRLLLMGLLALAAAAALLSALAPGQPTMQVTFFDVGDGQCTLVRTPGGRTMVVDCGTSSWRNPSSVGKKLLAPYLRSQGVNEIDALVLSHPHSDHMSGFEGLLSVHPARLVMDAVYEDRTPEYKQFIRAVRKCDARYRKLKCGQKINMGDGVVVEVIGPVRTHEYEDENDRSVVLRLVFGRTAMLLAADAGEEAESDMIDSGVDLRAQVLQVGHHGSAGSTSPEWLCAVKPSIAVISCSKRSRYGFPSTRVLDRLASFDVRTYTTGEAGAVTVTSDGNSVRVSTMRPAR